MHPRAPTPKPIPQADALVVLAGPEQGLEKRCGKSVAAQGGRLHGKVVGEQRGQHALQRLWVIDLPRRGRGRGVAPPLQLARQAPDRLAALGRRLLTLLLLDLWRRRVGAPPGY